MKIIKMYLCGTNKVIDCPKEKATFEPVPECLDCEDCLGVDYRINEVKCDYQEKSNGT